MYSKKELFITSFALFSLFFGAGNLLLPPLLGYHAGSDWPLVAFGFMVTAVLIPITGILAHARLQGTMFDFGKKISPTFSYVYCILVYIIAVAIPSPRTASATHEIAIHPLFGSSPLTTSLVYFALVFLFVLNRSKILNLIGKFLTPIIVIILLLVVGIGLFASSDPNLPSLETPFVKGLLEGYQTFDAIGAVVVGAVIIVSLNFKNIAVDTYEAKRMLIRRAGFMAGFGLFVIYAGLISVGAYYGTEINIDETLSSDMQRANLLRNISTAALGDFGNTVLSLLLALACFTTAVGVVAGTADFFKNLCNESPKAFLITAFVACALGVLVGQLNFGSIITIAIPVLMFIYPITIVLILLNVLSETWTSPLVFRIVIAATFVFSLPDVLGFIVERASLEPIVRFIPLATYNLGWVLPSVLAFVGANLFVYFKQKQL